MSESRFRLVNRIRKMLQPRNIFTDEEVVEIVQERNQLLKALSTPAPTATPMIGTGEADIQLPRIPFNQQLYYYIRWQSVILRTVVLKLKQEIFRETLKDGWDYKPRFHFKCVQCGTEYQKKVDQCQLCKSPKLRRPFEAQKKLWEDFAENCNGADQSLLEVLMELEDDVNTTDDMYLVLIKDYIVSPTGELFGRLMEVMRGDPCTFRIVADETGRRGGRWYTCVRHRNIAAETPGRCPEIIKSGAYCNLPLQAVHYVETEGGGKNPVKYYIEGEVVHASKYEPSRLYGISPIFTCWIIARTLQLIDRYNENLYEKGRLKGVLGVSAENTDYIEKWWDETQAKLRKDPHYMPVVAIESGEKGKGRMDFVKLIDSMSDMETTEYKKELRINIAAIFGISPIFQADVSAGGGLNNEGLQITVTDRAVDMGQTPYHNKIFPALSDLVGLTDWYVELRPSREQDEMAELQRMDQKVTTAERMANLGFDVTFENEEFIFTGQAKRVTEGGNSSHYLEPGQGVSTTIPDNRLGQKECPPGMISTPDNPRCHKIDTEKTASTQSLAVLYEIGDLAKGFVPWSIVRRICQFAGLNKAGDGGVDMDCVARKISIFDREHPEWEHDRVVAAALNYCRQQTQKSISWENPSPALNSGTTGYFNSNYEVEKTGRFYDKMPRDEYEQERQRRIREIESISDPNKRAKLIDQTWDDVSIYIRDRDGTLVTDNMRWLMRLEADSKKELGKADYRTIDIYTCDLCGKRFDDELKVKWHLKDVHHYADPLASTKISHSQEQKRLDWGGIDKARYPWEDCIRDMKTEYGSEEIAAKVCAKIKQSSHYQKSETEKEDEDIKSKASIIKQAQDIMGTEALADLLYTLRDHALAKEKTESGEKIDREQTKIETHFGNELEGIYRSQLLAKLASLESIEDEHEFRKEIDQLLSTTMGRIERQAFAEVLRAYNTGKQLTPELTKMSPIVGTEMGKTRSARRLISIIPDHKIYNEPFAGGASVFLKKAPAEKSFLNDSDEDLMSIYKLIKEQKSNAYTFLTKQKWNPSRKQFEQLQKLDPETLSKEDRAFRKLYLRKHSYNRKESHFTDLTLQDENRSDWTPHWLQSEEAFNKYQELLQSAELTSGDWLEPTLKADSLETFHFFDPPYNTPQIIREWSAKMLKHLPTLKGKWLLTFAYDEDTIKGFRDKNFQVEIVKYTKQLREDQRREKNNPTRKEIIVTNYPIKVPRDTLFKADDSAPAFALRELREFNKDDRQVLEAVFKENPFWGSFSGMSDELSDELKGIILDSYLSPSSPDFINMLRQVQKQYPDYDLDHQKEISYGRLGKMSLPRIIEKMGEVIKTNVYRLERIARSETTAITAKGREMALKQRDTENKYLYDWFGPDDYRTSDICRAIEKQVHEVGGGKGVPLQTLKEIMKDVVDELNPKWGHRDWLPHANCRRVLRRVGMVEVSKTLEKAQCQGRPPSIKGFHQYYCMNMKMSYEFFVDNEGQLWYVGATNQDHSDATHSVSLSDVKNAFGWSGVNIKDGRGKF